MSRESPEAWEAGLEAALTEGARDGREVLEARLASMERAYEELLQRVHGYERERAELRRRIARILSRIGASRLV
jgi:hypothetical protein